MRNEYPSKFEPPKSVVADARRYIRHTDGACLRNGQSDTKPGWVIRRLGNLSTQGLYALNKLAGNHADLCALLIREWVTDCSCRSLVIATDAKYLAVNVPERIQPGKQKIGKLLIDAKAGGLMSRIKNYGSFYCGRSSRARCVQLGSQPNY